MAIQIPSALTRYLAFLDLRDGATPEALSKDLLAALVTTFMAVAQCVAYAVIAGLPPAMGLYAATIPLIIGSLFRSSRHVITGPTNAVSLLVAGGVALMTGLDPIQVGITLALLVGALQFAAGVLRLGVIVDYISRPVVLGYITGAGLLIGVGQLHNVTGTPGGKGDVLHIITTWAAGLFQDGLSQISPLAMAMAFGTAALILLVRRLGRWWPAALIALTTATGLSIGFDLRSHGLRVIADLAPIPAGLPPITLPDPNLFVQLLPLAVACTVLSLVESSAVARAIASRSGQRLDSSVEFAGQGLANIAAGFFGGYPTSGSLGRSAINERGGAQTRMSGVFGGLLMLLVLLFLGPLANQTPIAALAGLLMVVAVGLVNVSRIKTTLKSRWGDRIAFIATLVGTWAIPLDKAIYLGVGISLVLFLRRARLLVARELVVDRDERRLREANANDDPDALLRCDPVRILHLEGRLFFGVEGELQAALDHFIRQPEVKVLVLRLKRTQGMDVSIAQTLEAAAIRLAAQDRHLILAGVRHDTMELLERTGIADSIGRDNIFTSQQQWFESMRRAISYACALSSEDGPCENCPLAGLARLDPLKQLSDNASTP